MEKLMKVVKPAVRNFYEKNREAFKLIAMDLPDLMQEVSLKVWEFSKEIDEDIPTETRDKILMTNVMNFMKNIKKTHDKLSDTSVDIEGVVKKSRKVFTFSEIEGSYTDAVDGPISIEDILAERGIVSVDEQPVGNLWEVVEKYTKPKEFQAISLRFREGLTLDEISRLMRIPMRSCSFFITNGIEKLKNIENLLPEND